MKVMESVKYVLDYAKIDMITIENRINSIGLYCICKDINDDCFEVYICHYEDDDLLTSYELKKIDSMLKNYAYMEV